MEKNTLSVNESISLVKKVESVEVAYDGRFDTPSPNFPRTNYNLGNEGISYVGFVEEGNSKIRVSIYKRANNVHWPGHTIYGILVNDAKLQEKIFGEPRDFQLALYESAEYIVPKGWRKFVGEKLVENEYSAYIENCYRLFESKYKEELKQRKEDSISKVKEIASRP